ncbi:MAG: DUF4145 domain-containing protein [Dehalococcoidia bacterium]
MLELSPRMSAVMSRRIVADLLRDCCGLTDKNLVNQIDQFVADKAHPLGLRDNLHYLREMGNIGAHTQKDAAGEIVDVSRDEAGWTLEVIDGLFEYLIVGPKRDEQRRAAFDQKLAQAGRRPINDAGA